MSWISSIPGIITSGIGLANKKSGWDAGRYQRRYMDKAYPGTTPWERLGAPAAAGSAAISAGASDRQTAAQGVGQGVSAAIQKQIADTQARAQVISAGVGVGPQAVQHGLDQLQKGGSQIGQYPTTAGVQHQKLGAEIRELEARTAKLSQDKQKSLAETLLNQAKLPRAQYEAKVAELLVDVGINREQTRSITTALYNLAGGHRGNAAKKDLLTSMGISGTTLAAGASVGLGALLSKYGPAKVLRGIWRMLRRRKKSPQRRGEPYVLRPDNSERYNRIKARPK